MYIRKKLESIERLATPVGSMADAKEQQLRMTRVARREALREGSVRLIRVPRSCAPFVASGLLHVASAPMPVRDVIQKGVPEGEEYLLSLTDAVRLTDDLETCVIRVLPNEATQRADPGFKAARKTLLDRGLLTEVEQPQPLQQQQPLHQHPLQQQRGSGGGVAASGLLLPGGKRPAVQTLAAGPAKRSLLPAAASDDDEVDGRGSGGDDDGGDSPRGVDAAAASPGMLRRRIIMSRAAHSGTASAAHSGHLGGSSASSAASGGAGGATHGINSSSSSSSSRRHSLPPPPSASPMFRVAVGNAAAAAGWQPVLPSLQPQSLQQLHAPLTKLRGPRGGGGGGAAC